MKNSKEMADAVFQIRDARLEKRARLRHRLKQAAAIGTPVCMLVIVLVGVRLGLPTGQKLPRVPEPLTENAATEANAPGETETALTISEATAETSFAPTEEITDPPETEAETDTAETDAEDPEESSGDENPESSPAESQQEQEHTDPPATEHKQPDTQRPPEPAEQQPTGEDTGIQSETVSPATEAVFDEPPPHLLYAYARFGEEERIYQSVGLEVGEKELGDCLGDAEMFDGRSGTHRLTVKAYLVKDRAAEEYIAVYFPEAGYYLYQITNEIPDYLQRS